MGSLGAPEPFPDLFGLILGIYSWDLHSNMRNLQCNGSLPSLRASKCQSLLPSHLKG